MPDPTVAAAARPFRKRVALRGWLVLALVLALLDQLSKQWVLSALKPGEAIELLPFASLVLWFNRGAAFSFLADGAAWQRAFLIAIAVGAVVLIVWLLRRHRDETLFSAGLALVLGGAVGNLWDRLLHGHVVDFVLLHAGGWHWPAFNLADSAITVGAAMIIIDGFRHGRKAQNHESDHI